MSLADNGRNVEDNTYIPFPNGLMLLGWRRRCELKLRLAKHQSIHHDQYGVSLQTKPLTKYPS